MAVLGNLDNFQTRTGEGPKGSPVQAIAARYQASAVPQGTDQGVATGRFRTVRTLIDYAGAVTACNLRMYVREEGGATWYRGVSTDETGYPLNPAAGNEARDWDVGAGMEVLFAVEGIAPGTSGNTVAVRAVGVR